MWHSVVWNTRSNTGAFAKYLYENLFSLGGPNETGEVVNSATATQITAVYTPLNGISQDVAKLPLNLYKDKKGGGNELRRDNPIHHLIHTAPNNLMGAFQFWYCMMFNALRGCATALIVRRNGQPIELIPFTHNRIVQNENTGEIWYETNSGKLLPDADVFALKMYSLDGVTPVSPIEYNANLLGYSMKVRRYAVKVIGTNTTGFISSDGIGNEEGTKMAEGFKKAIKDGKIPFLGSTGQTKWNRSLITPEEGQYLETTKMTNRQIMSGIYRYHPSFAGDNEHSTYANAEQQDIVYAKYTLTPWLRLIEDEVDRKLLPESNKRASLPLYSRYDTRNLMRGDMAARTEFIKTMKDGVMTIDEIRALEDLPPLPDGKGDTVYIQGANVPIGTELNTENDE